VDVQKILNEFGRCVRHFEKLTRKKEGEES